MGQRFKVVVFDLDGTLLDTSEGLMASVRYTIDQFGLQPLDEEKLKRFIGPPIQDSFAEAYQLKGPILQEIATVFRNRYKMVDLLKAKPYKGIYDLFRSLTAHEIRPAIATYKRQDYATMLLTHFGFDQYTDIMFGADHENKLKKRDIIENALLAASVHDHADAVMVGDSVNDAIGARDIGTKFVGVTYGFGFKSREEVDAYPNIGAASDVLELEQILVGNKI